MHIHCLTDTDKVVACVADTLNFLYKQLSGKWRCDIDSSQDRIKQCFLFRLRNIYLLFLWYKVFRCVSIFSFLNCKNIYHKSVPLAVSSLDPFTPPILLPPNTPPPHFSPIPTLTLQTEVFARACTCDWRYILYKGVFVSLFSPYMEINEHFLFLYVSPNRNSIFIYCILRNLQAETEFPFLEEESPPMKLRHPTRI